MPIHYVLQPLLQVRELREEDAKNNVIVAIRVVEEAKKKLESARDELADYKIWREEEEARRYEELIGKQVGRTDLDHFHQGILKLREKLEEYEDGVLQALKVVKEAEEKLQEARAQHKQAIKDLQKIESHREIWMAEAMRELEVAEDKELEEFTGRRSADNEFSN